MTEQEEQKLNKERATDECIRQLLVLGEVRRAISRPIFYRGLAEIYEGRVKAAIIKEAEIIANELMEKRDKLVEELKNG